MYFLQAFFDIFIFNTKKQMESSTESKFALIVGPKEFADNKVVLRNMKDRSEELILIDDLIKNADSILKKP